MEGKPMAKESPREETDEEAKTVRAVQKMLRELGLPLSTPVTIGKPPPKRGK
jgi:hypothetical protein